MNTPLKKISINTLILTLASIGNKFLAFATLLLIARFWGSSFLGQFSFAVYLGIILSLLSEMGLHQILTREIARGEEKMDGLFQSIGTFRSILCLFFGVLFFAGSVWVSADTVLVLIVFSGLLYSMSETAFALFRAKEKMILQAGFEGLFRVLFLGATALTILFGGSFASLMVQYLFLVILLDVLIYCHIQKKWFPLKWNLNPLLWKRFILMAGPVGVQQFIYHFYDKADFFFLKHFHSTLALGYYAVGVKFVDVFKLAVFAFASSCFPVFSRLSSSPKKEVQSVVRPLFAGSLLIAFYTGTGAFFFADKIIGFLLGKEYEVSISALKILSLLFPLIIANSFFQFFLISRNLQKKIILPVVMAAFLNIFLNFFIIPEYNFIGACWTTAFSEFLLFLLLTSEAAREDILEKPWTAFVSPFLLVLPLVIILGTFLSKMFIPALLFYLVYPFLFRPVLKKKLGRILNPSSGNLMP